MRKMGTRKWHVQGSCAKTGEGIFEAMSAMAKMIPEEEHTDHKLFPGKFLNL